MVICTHTNIHTSTRGQPSRREQLRWGVLRLGGARDRPRTPLYLLSPVPPVRNRCDAISLKIDTAVMRVMILKGSELKNSSDNRSTVVRSGLKTDVPLWNSTGSWLRPKQPRLCSGPIWTFSPSVGLLASKQSDTESDSSRHCWAVPWYKTVMIHNCHET